MNNLPPRRVHREWDEKERSRHGQQVSERFARERELKITSAIAAIESLISQGILVTQNEVARQTGLSVGFVNKHLKSIITQANQRQKESVSKPVTVSSINALQKDLSHFKLTNHRLHSELSLQKRINKELLAQVARVVDLEVEVELLRKQSRELIATLKAYEEKVNFLTPTLNKPNSNFQNNEELNSSNIGQSPPNNRPDKNLNERVKAELEKLGISLNSTLKRQIKSKSAEVIINAIEALKQALTEKEIKNPGGWLATAIENEWVKNLPQTLKEESNYQPSIHTASSSSSEELLDLSQIDSLLKGVKE